MFNAQMIAIAVQVLLIAGALNWGLVAYNGSDAVQMLVGKGMIDQYIKYAVAAAGLYTAYGLYRSYAQ